MGKKAKRESAARAEKKNNEPIIERPNPPQPKVNQVTGEPIVEEEISDAERYTRLGVGIAHVVGSAVVGAYAGPEAGKLVYKEVGALENEGLDKAFEKEKA